MNTSSDPNKTKLSSSSKVKSKLMNKEIPLMLDSTVLKQVPKLNSQLFKELIKHVHVGIFKLYLSEIVEKEYLTWINEEAQQAFDNVVKATESLNKYYEEPDILGIKFSFNITANAAHSQINDVLKKAVSNWENFKKSTNATVLPIGSSHGNLVMSSYFSGDIPFKKPKNRSDIPDGFIYYSIIDLLKNNDKILFISSDKNLVKKISGAQVICFENLTDLFSNKEYGIQGDFFQKLENNDRANFLFKYFTDEIHRKAVHQIEFSDLIYSIEGELVNNVVGEFSEIFSSVETVTFDKNNIKVISKNAYLIPFSAVLVHLVKSESSKDDLLLFSVERISNLQKERNDDGKFEISESFKNMVIGNLSVIFEDSNPVEWEEKKSDGIFKEPEIEEIIMTLEDIKLNT